MAICIVDITKQVQISLVGIVCDQRDVRALEGGLDPDCRRSFPWDHKSHWNQRILEATKDLVALRHQHPALRSSNYHILWPPDDGDGSMMFAVQRSDADERLVVVVNAGNERETQAIARSQLPISGTTLVWGDGSLTVGENQASISVAPRSAAIWLVE